MNLIPLVLSIVLIFILPFSIIVLVVWKEYKITKGQRIRHREKLKQIQDLISEVEKQSKKSDQDKNLNTNT